MTLASSTLTPVSGPRGAPLLGVIPQMARDPIQLFMDVARDYGGLARLPLGPRTAYLVTHPDYLKHVLQDNYRNYIRGDSVKVARRLMGNGLALADGDHWLRQRRLMQPAFHRQRLAKISGLVAQVIAAHLDDWRAPAAAGTTLDLVPEMMRLTLTVIVRTMFSADVSGELQTLARAFESAQAEMLGRTRTPFEWPDWLPTPSNRRYQQAVVVLDQTVYRLIAQARREPRDDLLGMLLAARDEETGQGMTDAQLRDEVMTIFFAGHETTATLLGWAWHVLGTHPEVEARLRAEVASSLGGRPPSVDDLPRLEYMNLFVQEVLRRYSPVWILARVAVKPDRLGGHPIPAGAMLMVSPYVTHLDPAYWPEPERFDPERFTPQGSAGRPRHAYWPFGLGPHLCIGNNFALMEAQLALAMTLQRYRVRLVPGQTVRPRALVTLRPERLLAKLEAPA